MPATDLERLNEAIGSGTLRGGSHGSVANCVREILEVWLNRNRHEILVPVVAPHQLTRYPNDIFPDVEIVGITPERLEARASFSMIPNGQNDVRLNIAMTISIDRNGKGIRVISSQVR